MIGLERRVRTVDAQTEELDPLVVVRYWTGLHGALDRTRGKISTMVSMYDLDFLVVMSHGLMVQELLHLEATGVGTGTWKRSGVGTGLTMKDL